MKKIREESVKMFVALMFTLLPLYYSDNYYNILNDKKDVYYLFAYILIAAVACSLMISLAVSIYKKQGKAFVCNIWQQGNALDIVMHYWLSVQPSVRRIYVHHYPERKPGELERGPFLSVYWYIL